MIQIKTEQLYHKNRQEQPSMFNHSQSHKIKAQQIKKCEWKKAVDDTFHCHTIKLFPFISKQKKLFYFFIVILSIKEPP